MMIFQDLFAGVDALITNEFAYWNPLHNSAIIDPDWEMTGGTLRRINKRAWTGIPDSCTPNALSVPCTNSNVFRLVTTDKTFTSVKVSFLLNVSDIKAGNDWNGVHVFIGYVSEESLYYASIARKDGKVVIKKKVPGGVSNGGTYYNLSTYNIAPFRLNSDARVRVEKRNNLDGSVTINAFVRGVLIASATDYLGGIDGNPILSGGVGIRGDYTNFTFDEFTAAQL